MDPISAAGIGLSVVSLAFEVFGGVIKSYELFLDIKNMPEHFEHLRVRLRLEQERLLNWGDKIGLLEEIMDKPSMTLRLHRNLIVDLLLEIQRLFQSCTKVEVKFEGIATKSINAKSESSQSRQQKTKLDLVAKTMRIYEKTKELPKRLDWAVLKEDKYEKLIKELISYNDSIVSLLDRAAIDQLFEMQQRSQLVLLQMSTKVDQLAQLSEAVLMKAQNYTSTTLEADRLSRQTTLAAHQAENHVSIARLAKFKASHSSLELGKSSSDHKPLNTTITPLDGDAIELADDNSDTRTPAVYKGTDVWVEWKSYNHNQSQEWTDSIQDRIKRLAALLSLADTPDEFRTPHCLGYFNEQDEFSDRFGLVYSMPASHSKDTELISLRELITDSPKPSLTQRTALAHAVAKSLMYLHSVNWLHKGFRSDNIVFFKSPKTAPDYAAPTVSGFDYARPDLPGEFTERPSENFEHDIYRHPDFLRSTNQRSKKSWDIYSLGVVLIEIAQWKTVEETFKLVADSKNVKSRLCRVRDDLLDEEFLEGLRGAVGERYADVVQICVTGGKALEVTAGDDEEDPEVGAVMQEVFAEHIVGKLHSIQL